MKRRALPGKARSFTMIVGATLLWVSILARDNPAAARDAMGIIQGNYIAYMPTSGQAFVKGKDFYYEVYGDRGATQIIKSKENPIPVGHGVISVKGQYYCHSSLVKSTRPGTCTRAGWISN